MAHDDVVDDAVVRISPDLTGFRAKLEKDLKKAMTPPPEAKVKVTPDVQRATRATNALTQAERALQRQTKLTALTRADSMKDHAKSEAALAKRQAARAAEERKAAAEAKRSAADAIAANVARQRKDEQYRRFVEGNEAAIRKIRQDSAGQQAREANATYDRINAIGREGLRQKAILAAQEERIAKAALREVEKAERDSLNRRTARVSSAKTALSKLKPPKIIDLGGEGFKPMNLLIAGVLSLTPALLAMASSAVQASTAITALGAAGIGAGLAMTSLLVSFTPVVQAFKLAQTVDIQKSVASQKASVKSAKELATSTEDRAAALRDVTGAQRDLAEATRDERNSYAAIHTARQQAIRDLDDLRQSVIDLNNQYRSDALSVKEAQQQEQATNANFFASALERARAHQDTLDARTRLQDTALERRQKTADLAKSLKTGIERSDPVLAAKEKARDARNRRLDAQDRLANVKAAQSKKAINDSIGSGADAITSTEEQLKKLRAQMSPAQRELLDFLTDSQDLFKSFGRTMSQATLPGFTQALKLMALPPKGGKSTLAVLAEDAGELGGKLGNAAKDFAQLTRSPLFREDMAEIQKNNAASLETLGKAANTFVKPVLRILKAASPLLVPLSDKLLELARRFDTFIEKAEKSGELHDFFQRTRTEATKWYHIFANVFTLLKNIFTFSVPAGGGLVERFEKFTDKLAKWSESPEGQKQIKDFFDTIAGLPFGDIGKMLAQLTTAFAAWQAVRFVAINPFFTALGILATEHPELLARAMTDVAGAVVSMAEAATAHPQAAAFLLAVGGVLKYSKGARSIAFKLLGFEALGKFITGKIPWLEKFTKTATMNVQAGTVIVSGGGTGPGGAPLATAGEKGQGAAKPGEKATPKGESRLSKIAEGAKKAPIPEFLWVDIPDLEGEDRKKADRLLNALKKQDEERRKRRADDAAMSNEANSFRTLQGDIRRFGFMEGMPATDIKAIANRGALQKYIADRKKSVDVLVAHTRAEQGDAKARQLNALETQKSVDTLTKELVQYGVGKREAYLFASQQFELGKAMYDATQRTKEQADAIDKAKPKYDDLGNSVGTAAAKAHDATTKVVTLGETVDGVFKEHTLSLKTEGYDLVATQLAKMWNTQRVLYNPSYSASVIKGGADTVSSQTSPTRKGGTNDPLANVSPKIFKASGGHIRGPGTGTSDSIPAYLSNGEYVLPAKAVQFYGVNQLDAMRDREAPRYAKGGQVPSTNMPFLVNVKGTKIPDATEIGVPGTPYTGKLPKGLGKVQGLTAQMMAAVQDLKAHFPQISVSSGIRTGRAGITVTGNKSWHNYGRAADIIPPSMQVFNYLEGKYGKRALELIYTPAGNRQVRHGRPYLYRDSRIRAGHFSHVHLALANGGLVRSFDSGGVLPPGYTLAFNGTGKNETVRSSKQEQAINGPIRLHPQDLQRLAAAMHAGTTSVNMDGRRVAELTNRYNYLPAGV